MTCGAIYNHGCVMGDSCERAPGHRGDHGSAVLDSLPFYSDLDWEEPRELFALRRENAALRASLETAAAMVRKADPDLADALLRQINEPTIVRST